MGHPKPPSPKTPKMANNRTSKSHSSSASTAMTSTNNSALRALFAKATEEESVAFAGGIGGAPTSHSLRPTDTYSTACVLLSLGRFDDAMKLVKTSMLATDEEPTYHSVRSSSAYSTASELLDLGKVDEALELIEVTMMASRQVLSTVATTVTSKHGRDISFEEDRHHPSLAPLYYLYGTALLSSAEQHQGDSTNVDTSDDAVIGTFAGSAASSSKNAAKDIQTAVENLDMARVIMETRGLVTNRQMELAARGDETSDFATTTCTRPSIKGGARIPTQTPEEAVAIQAAQFLILDLSQIYLRLADAQKAAGDYVDCMKDYAKAMRLRSLVLGPMGVVSPYDHKAANDIERQIGIQGLAKAAAEAESKAEAAWSKTVDDSFGNDSEGFNEGTGNNADFVENASIFSRGTSSRSDGGKGVATDAGATGLLSPGTEDGIAGMITAAASAAADGASSLFELVLGDNSDEYSKLVCNNDTPLAETFVDFTVGGVTELMEASSQMKFTGLNLFETKLIEKVTLDNCVFFWKMADQFGMADLAEKAELVAAGNFQVLANKKLADFVTMPPEMFINILDREGLNVGGEEERFRSIIVWCNAQEDEDVMKANLVPLILSVDYTKMGRDFYLQNVDKEPLFQKHPVCFRAIAMSCVGTRISPRNHHSNQKKKYM